MHCQALILNKFSVSFPTFIGEIALLEGLTVVYKSNIDLYFYVIGSSHENEVIQCVNTFIIILFISPSKIF